MGKAFFLIAYGMAWGYVIHAREIDKKVAAVIHGAWDDFIIHNTRLQATALGVMQAQNALLPDEDIVTPEAELHAAG